MEVEVNEKKLLDGFVKLSDITADAVSVLDANIYEWCYDYDWWTGDYRIVWKTDSGVSGEFEIDPWYRPCHSKAMCIFSTRVPNWEDKHHGEKFFHEEEVEDLVYDVYPRDEDWWPVESWDFRENLTPEEYYSSKSKFHFKEFAQHAQSPRKPIKVNISSATTEDDIDNDVDLPF